MTEEKVMMANSRAEATKAKSLRLRKDLIKVMDQVNEAKAKLKEVFDQLRTEKILIIPKDKEIQSTKLKVSDEHEKEVAEFQVSEAFGIITFDEFFKDFELLRRCKMKHHSEAVNYSDLDFEAINKEMIADEEAEQAWANEQTGVEGGCEGEGPEEVLIDPHVDPAIFILLYFGLPLFLG